MDTLQCFVYPAVDELARARTGVVLVKHPDTPLIGPAAALDSLALVTLVVTLEARVADELGRSLTLATEDAMSRTRSPFRTLGTLAAYLDELLAAANP